MASYQKKVDSKIQQELSQASAKIKPYVQE